MTYVDGFVIPLPKRNLKAYRSLAAKAAKVWMKHGAVEYFECAGDDLRPKWAKSTFPRIARLKPGETVVFSFIVYKSKAHRNRVNAAVMKDPLMSDPALVKMPMPFDLKRMTYGGFRTIVQA